MSIIQGCPLTLYQPMTANAVMTFVNSPKVYGNLYGGFNTRRYTLVHGFCFFKLFSIGCIGLRGFHCTTQHACLYHTFFDFSMGGSFHASNVSPSIHWYPVWEGGGAGDGCITAGWELGTIVPAGGGGAELEVTASAGLKMPGCCSGSANW